MSDPSSSLITPGRLALAFAVLGAACGDGGTDPPVGGANCDAPTAVSLTAGQHIVVDPSQSAGCVSMTPQAEEREFLISLSSGAGQVTESGVSGPYAIRIAPQGATAAAPASPQASPRVNPRTESVPAAFHRTLRERERELSAQSGNRIFAPASPAQAVPPVVGAQATFNVCRTTACNTFDQVTATAKAVGTKVAIFQDNTVPTNDPLQQSDFDELARTFDTYHYPIDIAAFGSESDLDGNGVVIVLLTDAVNALTPNCDGGRILGYFYGGDLLNIAGSNHGEVFYAMVPAPDQGSCQNATRVRTVARLKPTLIHEFQHMISFNQHALVRSGDQEARWLNEGLSHFAEELGYRKIPDSECKVPELDIQTCFSMYSSGDLFNAYDYMGDTEAYFLVSPGGSGATGTLEERGAGWLFVRWLADQFGTDADGSNVTRALVATQMLGAANVAAVTGQPFETLVGEWQLALWLDDLPSFVPVSNRLRYTSWNFRDVFARNCCGPNKPFELAFPFTPVNASTMPFTRSGTLRGGSGKHFSLVIPSGSSAVDILVARTSGGDELDPALDARIAIARIR